MAAYTGTPRTWTAGETVTAALMNSDVRDPLAALAGAWTSYTPTLAQGGTGNISKTVTYAKYIRVGKFVVCQWRLSATGTGTAGASITASLPFQAAQSSLTIGSGAYSDGGTVYSGVAQLDSTTTCGLARTDLTWTTLIGAEPSIAVASGDVFDGFVVYEAA